MGGPGRKRRSPASPVAGACRCSTRRRAWRSRAAVVRDAGRRLGQVPAARGLRPEGLAVERGPLAGPGDPWLRFAPGAGPWGIGGRHRGVVKRSYVHWADEPIPALNGQTPRQAIGSATGLERVKGLLRSYEDGEARMAAQTGAGRNLLPVPLGRTRPSALIRRPTLRADATATRARTPWPSAASRRRRAGAGARWPCP